VYFPPIEVSMQIRPQHDAALLSYQGVRTTPWTGLEPARVTSCYYERSSLTFDTYRFAPTTFPDLLKYSGKITFIGSFEVFLVCRLGE
jgi:hypothetical protein